MTFFGKDWLMRFNRSETSTPESRAPQPNNDLQRTSGRSSSHLQARCGRWRLKLGVRLGKLNDPRNLIVVVH